MRLLCVLLAAPAAPLVMVDGLQLRIGAVKADCVHAVGDVSLGGAGKCKITKLNEKYPLGTMGEVELVEKSDRAYAGRLSLNAGAEVKPHQHDTSVEVVVMLSGRGTFTLDGKAREVGPGETVVVPKGTLHAFVAGPEPVKVVQFYVPPGPEERFRPKP
ncbi:MAG: cupin domain-containing protein [Myxococcaceae bacterium]|nr:cupin domain-containing protein [Myxococcaceae bacterium]